jgi:hypothetical protein
LSDKPIERVRDTAGKERARRKDRDMTGKFLLIVSDDNDGNHAEVATLDTATEIERRIESLLAAGFDADRIQVFTGGPTGVNVTQQPVVHLVKRDSGEVARFEADPGHQVERKPAAAMAQEQGRLVSGDVEREPVAVGVHAERHPATQDDDSAILSARIRSISRSRVDELRNETEPAPTAAVSYGDQPDGEVRFSDLFRRAYVG